jgi:hypothetical protein
MGAAAALPIDVLDAVVNAVEKHDLYSGGGEERRNKNGVPTLKDELERKTLDELQRLVLALEHGKVSQGYYNAAVESLWMTTAGLVSKDIMNLIDASKRQLVKPAPVREAFVTADEKSMVIVTWMPATGDLCVTRHADGKLTVAPWSAPKDAVIPSLDASKHFHNIVDSLTKMGMKKL